MKKYKNYFYVKLLIGLALILLGLFFIRTRIIEAATAKKSNNSKKPKKSKKSKGSKKSKKSDKDDSKESGGDSAAKAAAIHAAGQVGPHVPYTLRHASTKYCLGSNDSGFGLNECMSKNKTMLWSKMRNKDDSIRIKNLGNVTMCLMSNTPMGLNSVQAATCAPMESQKWKITPSKAIQYMGADKKGACLGVLPSYIGVKNMPAELCMIGLSPDYCNQQWDV